MEMTIMGQKALQERVHRAQLCTGCGACVDLCPYQVFYNDQTIVLDACDLKEGRCYAFCPRTPADLQAMRDRFFAPADWTPEVGAVKGYLIARAADGEKRRRAQHGGTVSALMALALDEGLIDTAVVAEGADRFLQRGVAVGDGAEVLKRGKSRFIAAATVAAFNRAVKGPAGAIGVVATPCQVFALAKMRMKPLPERDNNIDKLKLVIGLFCGWTLQWRKFTELLAARTDLEAITGMDIPQGKRLVVVYTRDGSIEIPWAEVAPLAREACGVCIDTTAEFADLSVGSARIGAPWEETRTWNQVIVRTEAGQALLDLARRKGVLEFREPPAGALAELKAAALDKKRQSLGTLIARTGDPGDLIYLDPGDPMIRRVLA